MNVSSGEINNLDKFIEQLVQCKPLKETEVKFLCEKVKQIYKN
jgi:serine/threonine-protein phosphatase 2A catalytic subunit